MTILRDLHEIEASLAFARDRLPPAPTTHSLLQVLDGDVPALVGEVRRLRAALEAIRDGAPQPRRLAREALARHAP